MRLELFLIPLSTLIGRAINFLTYAYLAKQLPLDDFNSLSYFLSIQVYLTIIFNAGLDSFYLNRISGNPHKLMNKIISLNLLISIFLSLLILILNTQDIFPLVLTCFIAWTFSIQKIKAVEYQNDRNFRQVAKFEVIPQVFSLILSIAFIELFANNYLMRLVALSIGFLYVASFAFKHIFKKQILFSVHEIKAFFIFSIPVVINALMSISKGVFERFLIDFDKLGSYFLCYTLASIVLAFNLGVTRYFQPNIFSILKLRQSSIMGILKKYIFFMIILGVIQTLLFILLKDLIINVFSSVIKVEDFVIILQFLISFILLSINSLLSIIYIYFGKTSAILYVSVISFIVYFGALIFLNYHDYEIIFYPSASIISNLILVLLSIIYVHFKISNEALCQK